MLSGRRLDLLDPSPLDVEIEDIAHGLARVARWNGQTERRAHFFRRAALAAGRDHRAPAAPISTARPRSRVLLHDAPEYVIGDMISPFKAVIGDAYKAVEARLLAAIHLRFGLPADAAGRSRRPDQGRRPSARAFSRRRGLPDFREPKRGGSSAPRRSSPRPSSATTSRPGPPETAEARFLERFAKLARARRFASRLSLYKGGNDWFGDSDDSRLLARAPARHGRSRPARSTSSRCSSIRRPGASGRGRSRRPTTSSSAWTTSPMPMDGYVMPCDEHVDPADRLRARLGPRHADGGALLCRHQPLDRGRLVAACALNPRRDEMAIAQRAAPRLARPRRPIRASWRSPTACSAATAAWSRRSTHRPRRDGLRGATRSGSIWNSSVGATSLF